MIVYLLCLLLFSKEVSYLRNVSLEMKGESQGQNSHKTLASQPQAWHRPVKEIKDISDISATEHC